MTKKLIYIAGPISGRTNNNEGAFRDAATLIQRTGHIAVVPHDLFLHKDTSNYGWHDFMRTCIAHICTNCDVMVTLPDWHESEGAKMEVELWRKLGNEPVLLSNFIVQHQVPQSDETLQQA